MTEFQGFLTFQVGTIIDNRDFDGHFHKRKTKFLVFS